jgi:glycerate kinase
VGLGAALFVLGATVQPGIALVQDAVGLDDRVARADLVVTGEGRFDSQSLVGKVVSGVARTAGQHAVPCVVLAGDVQLGRREAAAAGVEQAWSLVTWSAPNGPWRTPQRRSASSRRTSPGSGRRAPRCTCAWQHGSESSARRRVDPPQTDHHREPEAT